MNYYINERTGEYIVIDDNRDRLRFPNGDILTKFNVDTWKRFEVQIQNNSSIPNIERFKLSDKIIDI